MCLFFICVKIFTLNEQKQKGDKAAAPLAPASPQKRKHQILPPLSFLSVYIQPFVTTNG